MGLAPPEARLTILRRARIPRPLLAWFAAHIPELAVLVLAAALRAAFVATRLPYSFNDSSMYLSAALRLAPRWDRPLGYSLFLRAVLEPVESLRGVVAIQHALALAGAVLGYQAVRRLVGSRVAAVAALAAVALSPRSFLFAQYVLAESLFVFLLLLLVRILVGGTRCSPGRSSAAGFVLAALALVRVVGLGLLPVAALWVWMRRSSKAAVAALVAATLVPLAAYAGFYRRHHGAFAVVSFDGWQMYGLVSRCFDCGDPSVHAPTELCARPYLYLGKDTDFLMWDGDSPAWELARRVGPVQANGHLRRIAWKTILRQPTCYARTVAMELREFLGDRESPPGSEQYYWLEACGTFAGEADAAERWRGGVECDRTRRADALARTLASLRLDRTLLAGGLALACAWLVIGWRRGASAAFLPSAFAVVLALGTACTSPVNTRYFYPLEPLLVLSVVLAAASFRRARSSA